MKLIRFGSAGQEKPGLILSDGRRVDASAFGSDYDEAFFAGDGLARLATWAAANASSAPTEDVRIVKPWKCELGISGAAFGKCEELTRSHKGNRPRVGQHLSNRL